MQTPWYKKRARILDLLTELVEALLVGFTSLLIGSGVAVLMLTLLGAVVLHWLRI